MFKKLYDLWHKDYPGRGVILYAVVLTMLMTAMYVM